MDIPRIEDGRQEIIDLGKRNVIVHYALSFFNINKQSSSPEWEKALSVAIIALAGQNQALQDVITDVRLKGLPPSILLDLNNLPKGERNVLIEKLMRGNMGEGQ